MDSRTRNIIFGCILALGLALGFAAGSHAATITIPVCDGYTVSNNVLSCPGSVTQPPPVTPPPVVTSACTRNISFGSNWPNIPGGTKITMGANDTVSIKFNTGSVPSSQTGKIVLFSGSGQDSAHDVTVSASPCDFTTPSLTPQLKFTIGTKTGSIPVLALNSTYYINLRNTAGAVCLSGAFTCDLFLNLVKPAGL